jgi:hypothetical protein
MPNEEPPGLCHAGAGRHPDPSSTWIPFFNGMTDTVRHLDSRCHGNDGNSSRLAINCSAPLGSSLPLVAYFFAAESADFL